MSNALSYNRAYSPLVAAQASEGRRPAPKPQMMQRPDSALYRTRDETIADLVLIRELQARVIELLETNALLSAQLGHEYLPGYLLCNVCHKWLPDLAFSFDRTKKNGHRGQCRTCDATRRRKP